MTDPSPIPGTPEAELRAWIARQEAAGAMERPRRISSPRDRWTLSILAALAWLPIVAAGYGIGRWIRVW